MIGLSLTASPASSNVWDSAKGASLDLFGSIAGTLSEATDMGIDFKLGPVGKIKIGFYEGDAVFEIRVGITNTLCLVGLKATCEPAAKETPPGEAAGDAGVAVWEPLLRPEPVAVPLGADSTPYHEAGLTIAPYGRSVAARDVLL